MSSLCTALPPPNSAPSVHIFAWICTSFVTRYVDIEHKVILGADVKYNYRFEIHFMSSGPSVLLSKEPY